MDSDRPRETRAKYVIPEPDHDAHSDGRLMHDLTVITTQVTRYILNHADADAGRAAPITPADEHTLADCITIAAEAIRARATRRDQHEQS